jgi:hypothetical protein
MCGFLPVCPVVLLHQGLELLIKQIPGPVPMQPWWLYRMRSGWCVPWTSTLLSDFEFCQLHFEIQLCGFYQSLRCSNVDLCFLDPHVNLFAGVLSSSIERRLRELYDQSRVWNFGVEVPHWPVEVFLDLGSNVVYRHLHLFLANPQCSSMLLNNIHRPVYVLKHNVSETGLCLRPQVKPTLLGPIGRAWTQQGRFYLRTETEDRTMDIVLKNNGCTNIPSSQTFRSNALTITYKEGDLCRRQKC